MKAVNFYFIILLFIFFGLTNCSHHKSSICHKNDIYLGDNFYFLKKKKYILYDLQKEILYRISLIIYKLNKIDKNNIYYLVLPPWCYLTHWKKKIYDKIKWEYFFNIKVIQNIIPVIEFSDYSNLYGDNVDMFISFKFRLGEFASRKKSFDILNFNECCTNSFKYKNICDFCEHKYSVIYSGNCTNLKAKNSECYEFSFITSSFVSNIIYNLFFYDIDSVLIKQGSIILVPFVSELFESNLEDILLFNEELIYHGNNYIKETLRTNNYLSAHLRYTDFKKISNYDVPPVDISIFKLLYIMFINENEKIFISTDDKKEVQRVINREFKEFKDYFYFYENKNYHEGKVAIIDQWICSKAKIFVGNMFSRYSFHIKWERFLMNNRYEKNNLDLCGYNINNNKQLKEQYKGVKDIYNKKALKKLGHIYYKYSDKNKKYINTICFGPLHFPQNTSIYRLKYINDL